MQNISTYYKLGKKKKQPQLEFIDAKLDDDNRLFIDPRLIEKTSAATIKPMDKILNTYVTRLVQGIITANRPLVNGLLSGLEEPKETRLGFGAGNSDGNSIGPVLKPKFEEAIRSSKVIKTGSVTNWSDLELFVENINCDRISDMTTKIIKKELIKFTQDQCKKHKIPMKKVHQTDIFNPVSLKWENLDVELPVYRDKGVEKPIIFVPKIIVRRQKDANSSMGYFFRYAIDNFAMNDGEFLKGIPRNGKDGSVLKKDIRKSITNKKKTMAGLIVKYNRLLIDFRSNVRVTERLKPLTDAEIEEIVYGNDNRKAA